MLGTVTSTNMSAVVEEDCQPSPPYAPASVEDSTKYSSCEKIVADVIHQNISLHPLCVAVIDTLEFQRLRDLSQCGLCNLVYPSAVHSRFEHSLGVYHLSREMMSALERNTQERIDERDKLCVMLAALCHDLGHGPFSHTWEVFLARFPSRRKWTHEENSVKMLDYLIEKNNLQDAFSTAGIGKAQLKFIANLILGESSSDKPERKYLYEIVANKTTSIDVDKWDYMMRDGLHFNIPWQLNYHRILSGISIYFNEKNKCKTISFRDKLADNLLEMFEFRGKMHKKCYQHSVAKRMEIMLVDALEKVNDFFKISVGDKSFKLSECQQCPEAFARLSDYIFYEILNSNDERFQPAAELLRRISKRQLYTVVGCERLSKPELITDDAKKNILDEMTKKHKETFSITFTHVNVGVSADPLESVTFFDKNLRRKFISSPEESRFNYTEILCFCTKWFEDNGTSEVKEMKATFKLLLNVYLPCQA